MNKVILVGRLGSDAELRQTEGGKSILKFSLATSENWKNSEGEKQERTEWSRCTLFGPRAESLAQYLTKGKSLLVEGSLRTSSYEKDGEKKYFTEVIVNNVEFLGGGRRDDNAVSEASPAAGGTTDEIPF